MANIKINTINNSADLISGDPVKLSQTAANLQNCWLDPWPYGRDWHDWLEPSFPLWPQTKTVRSTNSIDADAIMRAFQNPDNEYTLVQDDKGYILEVDVPGVKEEDIDITISSSKVLTVSYKRNQSKATSNKAAIHKSLKSLIWSRCWTLDQADFSKALAEIEDGVLTVSVPKVEKKQPEKIKITRK
jgi:HSP20 family molecular chaperone IbpA